MPSVTAEGGGVTEAARRLALGLAGRPEIALAVVAPRDGGAFDPADWPGVPIRTFRYVGSSRYRFSPGLIRHLLAVQADLLHLHGLWTAPGLAVFLAARLRRLPHIVTPHGMLEPFILRRSRRAKALVGGLYQTALLRRASAVQVTTDVEGGQLADASGRRSRHVIPNAAPEPAERPGPVPDGWPPEVWLPEVWLPDLAARRIYLFLGRLHEKKGCAELCDAWDAVCLDAGFARRAALVVCGWPDGPGDVPARVAALGLRHGNALFVGPRFGAEKAALLARAHFLVLPSKSEGMPMTVLEAWAAGTPVLMTEACRLPEGFAAGAALRIGEDAPAIAEGLRVADRLSTEERAAMAAAGRALVAARFSAAAVAASIAALYRAVADRARMPAENAS
nr:glycosyltransferase [Prosthecomicrobium pneumaticum]